MDRLGMKMAAPDAALHRSAARWSVALGLVAMTALTACQNRASIGYQAPPLTAEQRFPIVLREEPVILEVQVSQRSGALSAGQRSEISAFMHAYREQASGPLVIRAPSGTRNETAALGTVDEIRVLAAQADLPAAALAYRPYSGRGTGSPPVMLAYSGVKAQSPECGDWSESITANYENKPYRNFGCSARNNLAAMASNPRDLERPRALDPGSTERRQVVRDKYIKGEATKAKVEEDDKKGNASKVGQ